MGTSSRRWLSLTVAATWICIASGAAGLRVAAQEPGRPDGSPSGAAAVSSPRAIVDTYCVTCHNQRLKTGGLVLDTVDIDDVSEGAPVWEKVVRKLRGGAMPPVGMPRPDARTLDGFISGLETALDSAANARPNPGRRDTFHRLNRTEYQNAIRDLLALEGIDFGLLLPADDLSYGFDNIAGVLKLSPTLLERYLSAARKISMIAVGDPALPPDHVTYRVRDDLAQWDHLEGLPFGTRGGAIVQHYFPVDGEYLLRIAIDGNSGQTRSHEVELNVDGRRVGLFTLDGKGNKPWGVEFDEFEVRLPLKAGLHEVTATFIKITSAEEQTLPETYDRPQEMRSLMPFLRHITVLGPFSGMTPDETPSRRRIFACRPSTAAEEAPCAERIFSTLARRAYRRPVTPEDVALLMPFFEHGRREGGFEAGIVRGLERVLMSPAFLFRVEQDPGTLAKDAVYRISDIELASRLSFFLWSSIPDDELLDVAAGGTLREPAVLERQVRRMLASPKAEALVVNFAGQWLQLRNLDAVLPDSRVFPRFDDGLRQSFRRETELLVDSMLRENRSALDLMTADYTYLNERLARHYGVPGVHGGHFRRVPVEQDERRGLLGQGSILTVTSYAMRTSPVVRGKWILENILGTPPPPPPPNVPSLEEKKKSGEALSMREAMTLHRANPSCASCHAQMDPLGFALENFDGTGRWRTRNEANAPIDASASLPNGTKFEGVTGLRDMILSKPELFVSTLTEKLLTYALGRGVEYYDMPAVRQIVHDAKSGGYALSSLVVGIVRSVPFQMRRAES
ncbi:MAG: DUF1592 domain-containing protein [Acidimicrobiia bacterium]|nr:DUF1592 domain-containing protein [Acidimicrobiia bacterium]